MRGEHGADHLRQGADPRRGKDAPLPASGSRRSGLAARDAGAGCGREGKGPARRLALCRGYAGPRRSEEHTSELQSLAYLVCRLLLEKKKKKQSASVDTQVDKTTTVHTH